MRGGIEGDGGGPHGVSPDGVGERRPCEASDADDGPVRRRDEGRRLYTHATDVRTEARQPCRTAVLADELDVHSYRIHVDGTVTWTRKHEKLMQAKPTAKVKPAAGEARRPASSNPEPR